MAEITVNALIAGRFTAMRGSEEDVCEAEKNVQEMYFLLWMREKVSDSLQWQPEGCFKGGYHE